MPPKYESGAQKRKRKRNEIALIQSQVGDINKYFKSNNVNALNEDEVEIQPAHVNEVDSTDEEVSQLDYVNELFKTSKNVTKVGQLGNDGFKDWHNLHRSIKSHEGNEDHLCCMTDWIELENRLRTKVTIDKSVELLIDPEREHWRHVLTRIIAIIKRLAKNILSFRGDDERLNVENNGLFLQMVEMVSEFDPVMKEHLRRANAKEIQYTYLANLPTVEEHWLEFLKVDDTTGLGLATELQKAFDQI
ncbi:uncharacterized protein LOC111391960 [Olea europaea var. sylvestris]|uniref:uncharacterized protein LOC111391960 n=1 Tax=Olea europaea var. sylvestris TaxID=158386 RepID=UPI000C1D8A29|nr:uncharacterized protein LOC111391960 [Olea europaea var. sylvestris]